MITSTRILTTGITEIFQAVGQQAITVIYLCNTSNANVSINMFVVSDGSTSGGEENQILSQLEITANDTYVMSTEKLILSDLDQIEVEANVADAITTTVSSIEI